MAYLTTRRDPDEALVVFFKYLPMENPDKTLAEGRPIFDDVEVCEIRGPGGKDVKVFPSTEFCRWADDPFTGAPRKQSYAERFSHQYQQFKARAVQTKTGTPLEHAKFLSAARCAELRAQNVYTVEALAAIDGTELKNLGPGGREFKNQALEYIEESKSAAPNKQLEAELEVLRARNSVLEEDVASLRTVREQADAEFDGMSLDQLREYIGAHTGFPPVGTANRKTLLRMAQEARPDKVA